MWVSDHRNTASLSLPLFFMQCKQKETVKQQVALTNQSDWPKTCSIHNMNAS